LPIKDRKKSDKNISNKKSVDFTSNASRRRGFSKQTYKILQYLATHEGPQNAKILAVSLGIAYKTVHKTLTRLAKKGLVKKVSRGFFEFNHEKPVQTLPFLYPTRQSVDFETGNKHDLGLFSSSRLWVHRCGLFARVSDLWGKLKAAGIVFDSDFRYLRNTGFYRGRSLVYDAYVRLFSDGAYYQRSCEPIPLESSFLLLEDLRRTLQYYTKGLADLNGVYLNDFEVGRDYAGLSLPDGVSRVIFYPKRGKTRVHVQVKREFPLPLSPKEMEKMKEIFLDAIHEVHKIIDPEYAERVKVWDVLRRHGLAIRIGV